MMDCNPVRTPAVAGMVWTSADCPSTDAEHAELVAQGMLQEWYHSLVAALNFLASITREELRFVLGKLAKYSKNPGLKHFKALKHALRFLKGTLDYGVEFIWRASDPVPANG